VEENHPADKFADALGREEHLPVPPTLLLAVGDLERLEAPTDRRVTLVGREDPLAGRDQGTCCVFEGRCRHRRLPALAAFLAQALPGYRAMRARRPQLLSYRVHGLPVRLAEGRDDERQQKRTSDCAGALRQNIE